MAIGRRGVRPLHQVMNATHPDWQKRFFLIWAIIASVVALAFANLALVLFSRLRSAPKEAPVVATQTDSSPQSAPPPSRLAWAPSLEELALAYPTLGQRSTHPLNSSFTNLTDNDVAGRYRFFHDTSAGGIITLLPDHTMINREGHTVPQYRWTLQPDGILTKWRSTTVLFNDIDKPGVYVARRNDGVEYGRIEKVTE
jgi:hypothetical protein